MSVLIKLRVCAAAVFALLAVSSCGETVERSSSERSSDGRAQNAQPAAKTACPYVEARPTYLPWLGEGEEVPEPRLAVENGTSYIAWKAGGDDPGEQQSVTLRRDSEPLGGKGEPVSVRLEGAEGYYYDAPGAQAAVLWKTGSHSCDLITLALSLPGADRAELRDEILRIVNSLES